MATTTDRPKMHKNPKTEFNSETGRAAGKKGGPKSAAARRARKALKEELILLLSEGDTQKNMTIALLTKALDGDIKAFEVVRDTIGEKPITRVEADVQAQVNPVFDDLFALLSPPTADTKKQAQDKGDTPSPDGD